MEASADRAVALARNLFITNDEISQILTQHMSAAPVDPWQTACNWLRAKSSVWMSWLPNKTSCAAGWGLVNSSGHWVLARPLARRRLPGLEHLVAYRIVCHERSS